MPVRSDTVLPGGYSVSGVEDLKEYLIKHRSKQFAQAIVSRMTSYAVGRSLEFEDQQNINRMTNNFVDSDYKLRALIHRIIQDDIFQSK